MPPRDPAAAARAALPERYGRPRGIRPPLLVAAVAAVSLAAIGWLLWAAWVASTPAVTGGLVELRVVSDGRTEVIVEVRRRETTAVTCTLSALDDSAGVVGEEVLRLPAEEAGTDTVTASITTTRRAATARLESCLPG